MAEKIDGRWIDMPPAVRCFERYTSQDRATRAASFRLGYRQRSAVGEVYWTHPLVHHRAFPTRKAALRAAFDALGDTPCIDRRAAELEGSDAP